MKTYQAKNNELEKKWYIIDLEGKTLGRAATKIADTLRGKNKPTYTANTDTGDFVIAINAEKIKVTGNKEEQKNYYWHTGYIGGIKSRTLGQLREEKPEKIIKEAVKGMLPKGTLGRKQFKKFKVYAGADHDHQAQQPTELV